MTANFERFSLRQIQINSELSQESIDGDVIVNRYSSINSNTTEGYKCYYSIVVLLYGSRGRHNVRTYVNGQDCA